MDNMDVLQTDRKILLIHCEEREEIEENEKDINFKTDNKF